MASDDTRERFTTCGSPICYAAAQMARTPPPWSPLWPLLTGVWLCACSTSAPTPEKVAPQKSPAEEKAQTEAEPEIPVLTEEDLALIAADPKDLTVEQRRKRAYARRRQIMQNPDSPTARALRDLAEAHQAGEIDVQPKGSGIHFSAPGTKPVSGRPPAGWRPDDTPAAADGAAATPAPQGADAAAPADPAAAAP